MVFVSTSSHWVNITGNKGYSESDFNPFRTFFLSSRPFYDQSKYFFRNFIGENSLSRGTRNEIHNLEEFAIMPSSFENHFISQFSISFITCKCLCILLKTNFQRLALRPADCERTFVSQTRNVHSNFGIKRALQTEGEPKRSDYKTKCAQTEKNGERGCGRERERE